MHVRAQQSRTHARPYTYVHVRRGRTPRVLTSISYLENSIGRSIQVTDNRTLLRSILYRHPFHVVALASSSRLLPPGGGAPAYIHRTLLRALTLAHATPFVFALLLLPPLLARLPPRAHRALSSHASTCTVTRHRTHTHWPPNLSFFPLLLPSAAVPPRVAAISAGSKGRINAQRGKQRGKTARKRKRDTLLDRNAPARAQYSRRRSRSRDLFISEIRVPHVRTLIVFPPVVVTFA